MTRPNEFHPGVSLALSGRGGRNQASDPALRRSPTTLFDQSTPADTPYRECSSCRGLRHRRATRCGVCGRLRPSLYWHLTFARVASYLIATPVIVLGIMRHQYLEQKTSHEASWLADLLGPDSWDDHPMAWLDRFEAFDGHWLSLSVATGLPAIALWITACARAREFFWY